MLCNLLSHPSVEILFLALFTVPQLCGNVINNNVHDATTPVVIWHGMGDSCCNPLSMGKIKNIIETHLQPDPYVVSIEIGSNTYEDIENSFFMDINKQIKYACKLISDDKSLKNGFNAIGFSQGGQFLRALAQQCPDPPILNLISIGGQHQGVYGFPHCLYSNKKWCEYLADLLSVGAYWSYVQHNFVQAQYWHDPLKENEYKEKSAFLSGINNEVENNTQYRENLIKINNFVMVKFEDDTMVIPKDSQWFEFYEPGQDKNITKLKDSKIYKEDRIGLLTLDQRGSLHFLSVPGNHLQFTEKWFVEEIIQKYLK